MKVSIIIAFYNSHGVVARQVKHFASMNLPDDIEFILVDDGSNPSHDIADYDLKNLRLHHTNDKRAWTQGLARNAGAALARGEYVLMTDIDHILSKDLIMAVHGFSGDKMTFPRYFGVLLPDGTFSQEPSILEEYGLDMERLKTKRGLYASFHGNTFAMKKSTFDMLGGYSKRHSTFGFHPASRMGEDCVFNEVWNRYAGKNGISPAIGPSMFIFPIGRYHIKGELNPMGLFHDLSQEAVPQPPKE
ncbi:MAG: glycosyltransferase [Candidatus Paceibacterota bacterium]|jgi:glycosyltransferase involved in cell wall biosynthesis|nr:glycosyltransferase [Candidatus Paceibacterota bacterium]